MAQEDTTRKYYSTATGSVLGNYCLLAQCREAIGSLKLPCDTFCLYCVGLIVGRSHLDRVFHFVLLVTHQRKTFYHQRREIFTIMLLTTVYSMNFSSKIFLGKIQLCVLHSSHYLAPADLHFWLHKCRKIQLLNYMFILVVNQGSLRVVVQIILQNQIVLQKTILQLADFYFLKDIDAFVKTLSLCYIMMWFVSSWTMWNYYLQVAYRFVTTSSFLAPSFRTCSVFSLNIKQFGNTTNALECISKLLYWKTSRGNTLSKKQ